MEWVTKKLVAALVNRWFGDFIEDTSSQEINDALLSGQVDLTNVRVRKDALCFLDGLYEASLPIEVHQGIIGRISLTVPYSSIFTQPLIVTIQDVLLLVSPAVEYDAEEEKKKERRRKRNLLQQLFQEKVARDCESAQVGLLGLLYNRIWNNLQLKVNDVHIRYEDTTSISSPIVIGFCLQSLSAETTNQKWKKIPPDCSSHTVSKVIEVVSASVYVNSNCDKQRLVKQHTASDRWREFLLQGLNSFCINEEQFRFVVSPVRCKVKMRQHLQKEARVPGLLVDAIVKEVVNVSLDRDQYTALLKLYSSFTDTILNKRFRKYRPEIPLKRHAREWWQYAYRSVVYEFIRPFSWDSISRYRKVYREYLQLYKRLLVERKNAELEADVLALEDKLNIETITIGKIHSKIILTKEDPALLKPVLNVSFGWFSWLRGAHPGAKELEEGPAVDVVPAQRSSQFLSAMSAEERKILLQELSSLNERANDSRHKEDIDQKIYLSFRELTLTLRDSELKDIGLCIVTGLVLSLENRIGVRYQKVSIKMESVNLEAANIEDDLVHVLKLVEGTSTLGYGVALSCDFEIHPLNGNEDYRLAFKMDPVELIYHQEALSRLSNFFCADHFHQVKSLCETSFTRFTAFSRNIINLVLHRKLLIHLDMDIKSPYVILPEYGSIQKGGNVLIIDLGGFKVTTELGGIIPNPEEATQMELEEKLYDHLSIVIAHIQLIFSDSGDEWRVMRTMDDSDLHLLPRIRVKINFANNVYPQLKEHPQQKLDIHFTPLKLNMSDNRINHLIEFFQHFPILAFRKENVEKEEEDNEPTHISRDPQLRLKSPTFVELIHIRKFLHQKLLSHNTPSSNPEPTITPEFLKHVKKLRSFDSVSQTSLELAKYFPDESDEEGECLNKPVDLLGFEDNTSPSNMVKILSRFCIDEVILCISRSTDHGERPYLMIKVTRFLVESALMSYGPAIQVTVGAIHLVDKYHHCSSGEYLELLSSGQNGNVLAILYRKVRADCPDFKSHFHSCEQSLVVDVSTLNIVWQRISILTLSNFIATLPTKLEGFWDCCHSIYDSVLDVKGQYVSWSDDPPVPSGATKWSVNISINKVALKFRDNELDYLHAKLGGFQSGCVFKANEKFVFRASLADLLLEDFSDITLYAKIIEVEEDRVFEVKVVKFSPFVSGLNESNPTEINCKSDVSVSIQFGRLQCVLLYKVLSDVERFLESVLSKESFMNFAAMIFSKLKNEFKTIFSRSKISLGICIHTPTFLVPQKSDSPCLLVFNFGDFKVDNFFKPAPGSASTYALIENILLEVGPIEICRAVMTLGGGLELQEAILEPSTIRIDLKRSLMRQCRDVLSYDVTVNIDGMFINLGQRDLNTIMGVLSQNKSEGYFPESPICPRSFIHADNEATVTLDDNVGKLQAFLTHSVDIYRVSVCVIFIENIKVTLYTDMNEVLSSPVRDAATALCKLEIEEIEIHGDMNNDKSVELRSTVKSCDIFDVRADSNNFVKKIFGQFSSLEPTLQGRFKFNLPPLLEIMVRISPNGDLNMEISLDKVRLNISVGFILAFYKYIYNALPGSVNAAEEVFNPCGFTTAAKNIGVQTGFRANIQKPPSSSDSTSGYLSTGTPNTDDQKVISVSFKAKVPEIVLFIDPDESPSRIIVLRFDIQSDYSRHPGNESFKLNLDKIVLFTSLYSGEKQQPYVIIAPWYFEGAWQIKKSEEGEKVIIRTSEICVNICSHVVQILNELFEEMCESMDSHSCIELNLPVCDSEELWSPKPLMATLINSDLNNDDGFVNEYFRVKKLKQNLTFQSPSVKIYLEKGLYGSTFPVFALETSVDIEVNDWSKAMYMQTSFPLVILHLNEEFSQWEYMLDPIREEESTRPLQFEVHCVQHTARPIGTRQDQKLRRHDSIDTWSHSDRCSHKEVFENEESLSSSDEDDHRNNEMVILKPSAKGRQDALRKGVASITSISRYSLESDSETEGNLLYQISSTFSHMFSSGSENSGDLTEDAELSEDEDEKDEDMETQDEVEPEIEENKKPPVPFTLSEEDGTTLPFPEESHVTVRDCDLDESRYPRATSVIVSCKDPIEVSLSPAIMKAVRDLADEYSQPKLVTCLPTPSSRMREYKLVNEIGPNSKVSLLSYNDPENPADVRLVAEAKFREPNSAASSPRGSLEDSNSQGSMSEDDASCHTTTDWDNLNLNINLSPTRVPVPIPSVDSAFSIQVPDSVKLYEDITKHRINIEIAGFQLLEVFVGARSQNRVFQLRNSTSDCRYHVFVLTEISHDLVEIIVRSPLQVMNDLLLPMNICFKKSALQNISTNMLENRTASPSLSIESLSSLSNPFDEYPSMITLQPDQTFTVPLFVAYHSPIFVVPSATDYAVSENGFWWREMENSLDSKVLTCIPKSGDDCPISVTCLPSKGVSMRSTSTGEEAGVTSNSVANFILRLTSPIQVFNHLPFTLVLHHHPLPLPLTLDPGGSTTITKIDPHKDEELDVQICNYQGSDWKATLRIPIDRSDSPRTLVLTRVEGRAKGRLEVSLYVTKSASIAIFIYVPYWIVNKTGLPLQIRASRSKVTTESTGGEEILVFRYKKNLPRKLKIRVLESEWSRGWGCDAVGTCGVVICEDKLRNKKFRILARVSLSTLTAPLPNERRKGSPKGLFHPTKIVTLMPYFLVRNSTSKAIKYMQESDKNGLWFDIGPNQCESFWPDSDDMYLVVRRRESQVISQRFHFNSVHKTVLRMEKGRALVVTVEGVGTDSPVTISFSTYTSGDAPVRLENWCDDVFLRFHQRGSNQVTLLAPRQSVLYTWDDPTLQRDLLWNIYSSKNEDYTAVINMDKHGTERVTVTSLKAKTAIHTAQSQSSVDTPKVRPKTSQRQRTVTTPSPSSTEEEELADGWLLVGDSKGRSKKNTRIRGTQRDKMVVHWVCHKQRNQRVLLFTQSDHLAGLTKIPEEKADLELFLSFERIALSVINSKKREIIYSGIFPSTAIWQIEVDGVWKEPQSIELCAWLEDQYLYNKIRQVNLKGSLQIDFAKMRMTAPFIGRLRRLKHPALWIHYRQSNHVSYCRGKIQSIQVDNQQEDAIFPTVLSSNRNKACDKPSIDVCLILHSSKQSKTIRHLDCIIQDVNLNLDKGFVSSIYDLTRPLIATTKKRNIHWELKALLTPLTYVAIKQSERIDTSYPVERLCFGGVRFNINLSPKGLPSSSSNEKVMDLLEGLLASLGVVIGEIKNVGVSVSQFEMVAVTWNQVMRDMKNHFKHQILQQIYVLMLGLNILGNPYQRLRDLTQGVQDLVYDSQTGAIDRPDDYAEEIANECYSICGHSCGEETNILRILNSVIDCSISRLWFSNSMKVPRFSVVNWSDQQDWSWLHWFYPVGLVWYFIGMMSDPYAGSSQESIESFLRSRGKSLMGLISNASFGVSHPIAMATDGIRRALLFGYEANLRERPARHVSVYSAMRPINLHESEGLALLSSLPQGSLSHSDMYFAHVCLSNTKHPPIFLATTKHFYFLEPHGNWGLCEVVWRISISNLKRQPLRTEDAITFQLRQDESQSHLSGAVRLLQCSDPQILDFVINIITSLMTLQMEELPCPVLSISE